MPEPEKRAVIHKFYAVTISGSLYEVSDEKGENEWPIVRRISGPINPNMPDGTCLKNGRFIGIGDLGICLFGSHPKYGRRFEHMNIINWGGSTSGLVALFLDRESAEACVAAGNFKSLTDQYQEQTIAVLREIGDNHEVFSIGDSIRYRYGPSLLDSTTQRNAIVLPSIIAREREMDRAQEKESIIGSLKAHLSAFRGQRDEGSKDLVSVLALGLQEVMVREAIESCRKNGIPENEILLLLGEDTNLAVGGTRVEAIVTVTENGTEIKRSNK